MCYVYHIIIETKNMIFYQIDKTKKEGGNVFEYNGIRP